MSPAFFKTKNLVNSTLQVLDENDNNPQFVNVPGNFSVRENSPPGQHLNWWHFFAFKFEKNSYFHWGGRYRYRQRRGAWYRHGWLWPRHLLDGSSLIQGMESTRRGALDYENESFHFFSSSFGNTTGPVFRRSGNGSHRRDGAIGPWRATKLHADLGSVGQLSCWLFGRWKP